MAQAADRGADRGDEVKPAEHRALPHQVLGTKDHDVDEEQNTHHRTEERIPGQGVVDDKEDERPHALCPRRRDGSGGRAVAARGPSSR